jgi:hypothetical protein
MLVALEIVWTRIFSAEFFYSFAFLTVSLAGLGLGALSLRFWPAPPQRSDPRRCCVWIYSSSRYSVPATTWRYSRSAY